MPDYYDDGDSDVQVAAGPQLPATIPPPQPGVAIVGTNRFQMPVQAPQTASEYQAFAAMSSGPRTVQEANQLADEQARDMEFQRQLIQNARVQDASKAVESAMRFQGMRGYERDLQSAIASGLSPEQASTHALLRNAPKMFYAHPQSIAPLLNATRQVPAPSVVDLPGLGKAVRSGVRGERVQFPPASMTAEKTALGSTKPVVDPDSGQPVGFVVVTGPNTGHFQKAEGVDKLTPSNQIAVERTKASIINQQLRDAEVIGLSEDELKSFRKTKLSELDQIQSRLTNLEGKKPAAAKAAAPVAAPVAVKTKEERDALAVGTVYVGPDGKQYRKK